MAEKSEISWTDATFNWWEGCTKVGLGCDGCYAEARNKRFSGGQAINWGPGAPRRLTSQHNRNNLERWNRKRFYECERCGFRGEDDAESSRLCICMTCGTRLTPTRRRVFCSSLSDLFDNEVEQLWRDEMFAKAEACTNLDLYCLTKRIGNVRRMVPESWLKQWPSHIRLGATIVNQPEAERDIAKLTALRCPNFLSMEPLLGPVDLTTLRVPNTVLRNMVPAITKLDWVIVGGESGPSARPMHPDWVRSLRDQCAEADVPFHFKQWGEWVSVSEQPGAGPHHQFDDGATVRRIGKKAAGRLLDGRTHDGFPS
ncbi:MAG TPA: phage Gp37/Gp68 family protein [Roseateles sp.]|uniref:phage Gp37/Gp68 family protein n=1 Tax=Roseateles sp. TaxID=1971397 RepID=UPI002EDB5861